MIELVLIYCLSTDAHSCIEKRLPSEDFPTPQSCTMDAQMKAQDFLRDHPNYALKSWRCEVNHPHEDHA